MFGHTKASSAPRPRAVPYQLYKSVSDVSGFLWRLLRSVLRSLKCNTLQHLVRTAERIKRVLSHSILGRLPGTLLSIIVSDTSHPSHRLFDPFQLGRRFRSIRTHCKVLQQLFTKSCERLECTVMPHTKSYLNYKGV